MEFHLKNMIYFALLVAIGSTLGQGSTIAAKDHHDDQILSDQNTAAKVHTTTMEDTEPVVPVENGISTRIISEAFPHSRPFQVLLKFILTNGDNSGKCGGSLISKEWVLTAAHCFDPFNGFSVERVEVIMGVHNISPEAEESSKRNDIVIVNKQHVIIHENYFHNDRCILNDIALIRLNSAVILTTGLDEIKSVPLPKESDEDLGQNVEVVISGWGSTEHPEINIWGNLEDGKPSNVLRVATVKTLLNDDCKETEMGCSDSSPKICTNQISGVGFGSGDSGGPLTYDSENGPVLRGIVSYTKLEEYPKYDMYTRVKPYLPWIYNKTGNL